MPQAWRVLGAACAIYFLTAGSIYYGLAVVLKPLIETMGWTRTQGTSGVTVFVLTLGLTGPLVATLIDRLDIRGTVLVGAASVAIGAVTACFIQGLLHFYIALVFLGFGSAAMTFIPQSQLVARWFSGRRSLAMGILLGSAGLGAFIMTPLYALVLERTGNWRVLFALMGATVPISIALTLLVLRSQPGPGEGAGSASGAPIRTDARKAKVYQSNVDWSLSTALRTSALWVIVSAIGMGLLGLNLVNSQAILHLTDLGISQVTAGAAIGAVGLCSVFGRLGGGALGDRLEPKYLVAFGLIAQAAGILVLLVADREVLVYGFTAIFGVGFGLGIVTAPLMLANYFGVGSFARINGATGVVTIGLSAFGPTLAGYTSDTLGSYTMVFCGFSALATILAFLMAMMRPPAPLGTASS